MKPLCYWLPTLIVLLAACLAGANAHPVQEATSPPPWQAPTEWPDRVIVTLAKNPQTSFSVTWRTDQSVGRTIAQIAPATADARFDLMKSTRRAKTEAQVLKTMQTPDGPVSLIANAHLAPVHYHAVTFSELEPDTLYAYRVQGARGHWSPWRQVRTAPLDGPVQFIFFGDAQKGIRSHITRSFDTAAMAAPRAAFAIHGGDLVNTATYDKEWAEWFSALGRTAVTLPSIPVTGNHEYVNFDKDKPRDAGGKLFVARKRVSDHWRPQFTLPVVQSLPDDLSETVYDVRYGPDVHVFVLDSSGVAWNEQLRWLEAGIAQSDATWKILTMHHPLHSFIGGREHPGAKERRLALLKTMERTGIDLMLSGHRHTYQRGQYGDDVSRFAVGDDQAIDTVFIVTAASTGRGVSKVEGWRRYEDELDGDVRLERYGDNTPLFAVFDVEGGTLSYRAIDAVGEVYDAFTLKKGNGGAITLINDKIVGAAPKTYENTGPYRDWDDLR